MTVGVASVGLLLPYALPLYTQVLRSFLAASWHDDEAFPSVLGIWQDCKDPAAAFYFPKITTKPVI